MCAKSNVFTKRFYNFVYNSSIQSSGRRKQWSESSCWHESARKKTKGETNREMDGLRPKGYAGTADHPRGCPGQNILEIKNSGRWPHLVGKCEEQEEEESSEQQCFTFHRWQTHSTEHHLNFSGKHSAMMKLMCKNVHTHIHHCQQSGTLSHSHVNWSSPWLRVQWPHFCFHKCGCTCVVLHYKKVSSYIVQYPNIRIAQSTLHFTSLADLFNHTPSQLLLESCYN